MFRSRHELSNHGLDDPDISIQGSAEDTPGQSYPYIVGEAKDNHRDHRTEAAQQKNGLPANAVTQSAPIHAHHRLRQSEGRDEQARVCGCIFFVSNLEALDELPGVREDGGECNWLGKTNDC